MPERPLMVPIVPDDEWPCTWHGGHALVIEFGDEEFLAQCQCGKPFGTCRPDQSVDKFCRPWEEHVMSRELIAERNGRAGNQPADERCGEMATDCRCREPRGHYPDAPHRCPCGGAWNGENGRIAEVVEFPGGGFAGALALGALGLLPADDEDW